MKISRIASNYRTKEFLQFFSWSSADSFDRLAQKFKSRTGHSEVHFFLYGRSGLYYLLKSLGTTGQKVVLPAYSCVTMAHAIVAAGFVPVFLDSEPDSFQPDPKKFFSAIDEETAMIIPTHLFGYPEEFSQLYFNVKAKFPKVFVLQDCAHSFFCFDSTGKCVTEYGDGALFGCNFAKLVNTVKGGVITLRDQDLSQKMRELYELDGNSEKLISKFSRYLKVKVYGVLGVFAFLPPIFWFVHLLKTKTKILSEITDYYDASTIELPQDFLFRPFLFQAEIGNLSLDRYDDRIKRRREIASLYIRELSRDGWRFLPQQNGATWSHFPVIVNAAFRDSIIDEIEQKTNAEVGIIVDYSIPDLMSYRSRGYEGASIAQTYAKSVINFPLTYFEVLSAPQANKELSAFVSKVKQSRN